MTQTNKKVCLFEIVDRDAGLLVLSRFLKKQKCEHTNQFNIRIIEGREDKVYAVRQC